MFRKPTIPTGVMVCELSYWFLGVRAEMWRVIKRIKECMRFARVTYCWMEKEKVRSRVVVYP